MSDDRFTREPGDDEEPYEPHADRTHVDPKPRSWYTPAPPFDLAAECDKFLDEYCAKLGIKRYAKPKEKRAAVPVEPPLAPTDEDWKKLSES